jgi:hypothetical protein
LATNDRDPTHCGNRELRIWPPRRHGRKWVGSGRRKTAKTASRRRVVPCRDGGTNGLRARADKPEPNKHTCYRRDVTFNKCARAADNSDRYLLVEHIVNQFWLVPGNVLLTGLEIVTGRRANDPIGKQRNQITMDWCRSRRRQLPGHLPSAEAGGRSGSITNHSASVVSLSYRKPARL